MTQWPDDARLLATLAANALLLAAAWRVALRHNHRSVVAIADTLLLWIAAQYLITGTLGMMGLLRADFLLGTAAAVSILTLWRVRSTPTRAPAPRKGEDRAAWFVLFGAAGFAAACFFHQRLLPQLATDPLIYHTPAAAHWIQHERIELVDFWNWLPANTYSPLAGSVWIAWWMAPIGNDALARFVQLPAWLLLAAAAIRLLRDLRVPAWTAALTALALALCRPFLSQLILAKDDIYLAAFSVAALGSLQSRRLREPGGAVRLGLALGLLGATKYTAIIPLLLLAPAIALLPWRSIGWRKPVVAALLAAVLVAPWLLRNALLTGNPVYPIGTGVNRYLAEPALRTLEGIAHTLASSHHALPAPLWMLVAAGWVGVAFRFGRSFLKRPVVGSMLIGVPLSLVAAIALSPFAEVRYLYPTIAVGLLAAATLLGRRAPGALAAGAILLLALATSFNAHRWREVAGFCAIGALSGAAAMLLLATPRAARRVLALVGTIGVGLMTYLWWTAYLRHPEAGYREATDASWIEHYGDRALLWSTLRRNVPAGSTIAYANTSTIWPLYGFDLQFRVVHVPVAPDVTHVHDIAAPLEPTPAADAFRQAARQLAARADADDWIRRLREAGVTYLYIARAEVLEAPPEWRIAAERPVVFERMTGNDAGAVYRLRKP